MWISVIDAYGGYHCHELPRTGFNNSSLLVPPENFTRDGIYDLIVYRALVETTKFFWVIGFSLLLVGKLNLLSSYKVQPDDHIPWKKLPKVNPKCLCTTAIISNSLSDCHKPSHQSIHRRNPLHEVHILPGRACSAIRLAE